MILHEFYFLSSSDGYFEESLATLYKFVIPTSHNLSNNVSVLYVANYNRKHRFLELKCVCNQMISTFKKVMIMKK